MWACPEVEDSGIRLEYQLNKIPPRRGQKPTNRFLMMWNDINKFGRIHKMVLKQIILPQENLVQNAINFFLSEHLIFLV